MVMTRRNKRKKEEAADIVRKDEEEKELKRHPAEAETLNQSVPVKTHESMDASDSSHLHTATLGSGSTSRKTKRIRKSDRKSRQTEGTSLIVCDDAITLPSFKHEVEAPSLQVLPTTDSPGMSVSNTRRGRRVPCRRGSLKREDGDIHDDKAAAVDGAHMTNSENHGPEIQHNSRMAPVLSTPPDQKNLCKNIASLAIQDSGMSDTDLNSSKFVSTHQRSKHLVPSAPSLAPTETILDKNIGPISESLVKNIRSIGQPLPEEGAHGIAEDDAVNSAGALLPSEGFADSGSDHGSRFNIAAAPTPRSNDENCISSRVHEDMNVVVPSPVCIAGPVTNNDGEHESTGREAIVPSTKLEARRNNNSSQINGTDHTMHATSSVNLTEMAAGMLDDECSNYEEVASNPLVTIYGYRVKPDLAPILGALLSKYGDIAAHCSMQSSTVRSLLLQNICELIQKLQTTEFLHLMPTEIDTMREVVSDLEYHKVEVGWLQKRLDEIQEAKTLLKRSAHLKQAKREHCQLVEEKKKEMLFYVAESERCKTELQKLQVDNSIDNQLKYTKALVKKFHQRSLIDDLLWSARLH